MDSHFRGNDKGDIDSRFRGNDTKRRGNDMRKGRNEKEYKEIY